MESYTVKPAEPGTGHPCLYTQPNMLKLSSLMQELPEIVTHTVNETILLRLSSKAFLVGVRDH